MAFTEIFAKLGFEVIHDIAKNRIVCVRYIDSDTTAPKYKQACEKLIFDLDRQSVLSIGRTSKGGLGRFEVDICVIKAATALMTEMGWLR